jgi:CRP-like cAMP-binding protein
MYHQVLEEVLSDFELTSFLNEEEFNRSVPYFKFKELKKGEYLCKEGYVCRKIAIVKSGVLRSFYNYDGQELTTFFNMEKTLATALRSFLKEVPAHENIQAITDVELIYISKEDMNRLYDNVPAWNKIGRIVMEHLYVKMEERSISLQNKTAKERYLEFMKEFPGVVNRVPLQYIASFLGIAPETLSRIRKNLFR